MDRHAERQPQCHTSRESRIPAPPGLLLDSGAVTWFERATHRVLCPGYANRHPIESLARGGSAKLLSFTKKTKFELRSLKTFQKNQALSGLPSGLRAAWSTCQYRIIMILCSIESLVQAALAQLLAFTKKIKFELWWSLYIYIVPMVVRQSGLDTQRPLAVSNLNLSKFYLLNQFASSSAFDCMWLGTVGNSIRKADVRPRTFDLKSPTHPHERPCANPTSELNASVMRHSTPAKRGRIGGTQQVLHQIRITKPIQKSFIYL